MRAIYSAASGLKGQQTRLDTIAANISNVNTVGYKAARAEFKDALYTAMDSPVGGSEARNLRAGSGVLLGAISAGFADGPLTDTGGLLDFALRGDGFFTVEHTGGEMLYTRGGAFAVSQEGGAQYLVTAQGHYVLDTRGSRIALPEELTELYVTRAGVLHGPEGEIAVLGIAVFPNPEGLASAGDTCFTVTEASGAAAPAERPDVIQGSLEGSNVDLAQELTLLIRSQRAYALASRVLQTADQMEGLANQIR